MLRTAADHWFSLCVRERAEWKCERCGKQYTPPTRALHCAHYETRGTWTLRVEPINALALCYGCHEYFDARTTSPLERDGLCYKIFGEEFFVIFGEKERQFIQGVKRKIKFEAAAHYKAEYERMLALRAKGVTGRLEFAGYF